jgi:hypothetical protein
MRQSGTCIDPEFVVASPQVLDEGMTSEHEARGPVPFEASHRSKSWLEPPMVSFDPVGAENVIRGSHAASLYSWMRPPSLSVLRNRAKSGLPVGRGFVSSVRGAC